MKNSLTKLQKWLLIVLSILFSASMLGALASLRTTDAYAATVEHPLSRYLYYGNLTTVKGVTGYYITGFEYHESDGKVFGTETAPAVIPAQFNGYPIIGIADGVFGGANSIRNITFNRITDDKGNGTLAYDTESKEERALAFSRMPAECQAIGTAVREFGHNVFAASDIETITLPGSLAEQGDGTFFNCTSLKWVGSFSSATGETVKDMSQLPYLKNFGSKCFMYDDAMTGVVLPNYTAGADATQYYPEGKGLVEIGDTCFYQTAARDSEFHIPASATKMVEDPFDGLENVTSVWVEGDAGTYEDYPWGFSRKIVTFHGSHTSNNGTFYYNTEKGILGPVMGSYTVTANGTTISVPSSIGGTTFTKLAPGTFAGIHSDRGDKSFTVSFNTAWEGKITELPSACFKNSDRLTAVTNLPDSIEKIGTMAFLNCSNLKTVSTTSHNSSNTIDLPTSCTTIGFWAFKSTIETTVNIWATGGASDFLISQAAFVGNKSLTSVNFKNLTSGTPRQIGNLKERPEEESIWDEKTFPFGAIANANCKITWGASQEEAATVSFTTTHTANQYNTVASSVATGTWRCIILKEPDGGNNGEVQIVRTGGTVAGVTAVDNKLEIPAVLASSATKKYNVVKVGNPNGNNDARTLGSVTLDQLIFPEGVREIGYMVVSGTIGTNPDWSKITTDAQKEAQAKIVNLKLPSTLTKIDDWAFSFVHLNTALHLPENLRYIGLRTFENTTPTENSRTHFFNETLVMPAYLSYIHVSAFANTTAPILTDIYYMQYRTKASDKTFSRDDGKYMQFSGKNSSSSAGPAGIRQSIGGKSPTVHYMDDYTPYVYEIGAEDLTETERKDYLPGFPCNG